MLLSSGQKMFEYIENCVEKLSYDFPSARIILAGDLNQLSDADITVRTGLIQVVRQPTRAGSNILDRLFVSYHDNYSTVLVVRAVGKTDHKAIVAHSEPTVSLQRKETLQRAFRHKSPSQQAQFGVIQKLRHTERERRVWPSVTRCDKGGGRGEVRSIVMSHC